MSGTTRAVIDIGTNSVKLLIADVLEDEIVPLLEKGTQTRLGRGLYESGRLSPDAIERTAETTCDFVERCAPFGCDDIRIIATSAARDATNAADLTSAIRAATNVGMQIISGDDEARFVFRGAASHACERDCRMLVADVGGGSTELIIGESGRMIDHASFQLGTVRLHEARPPSDPPSADELDSLRTYLNEFIDHYVIPKFKDLGLNKTTMISTGGTSSILARIRGMLGKFERERIDETEFDLATLTHLTEQLWRVPLEERRQLKGLPPERADVILTGAAIYEALLRKLPVSAVQCSTRGLRFGLLLG